MNERLDRYNSLVETCGIPVAPECSREKALKQVDAVSALQMLEEDCCAVLGGDVYRSSGSGYTPEYANWHCNRMPHEDMRQYSKRSIQMARHYILSYPIALDLDNLVFVLVVD